MARSLERWWWAVALQRYEHGIKRLGTARTLACVSHLSPRLLEDRLSHG